MEPEERSSQQDAFRQIQQAVESITDQHSAERRTDPPPDRPLHVITESSDRDRSDNTTEHNKNHTLQQRIFFAQIMTAVFTAAAFVAAFWYAGIAQGQWAKMAEQSHTLTGQWQTMRHQWAAMQLANAIASRSAKDQIGVIQKQLEAANRPWIQVTNASVVTPLTFEGNKISVGIRLAVKSVGNSAAMQIGPKWQLIVSKGAGTEVAPIIKKQEEVCFQKRVGAFLPLTLFPGQSSGDVWADALQLNSWVNDISDQIVELPLPSKPKVIFPILVGCIDYQSSFGTHYQSRFAYNLQTNGYFAVGRNVSVEQLRWGRYAFGGFDVN